MTGKTGLIATDNTYHGNTTAVAQIPGGILGSGRTLAVHMYALSGEGLHMPQAYGTAVILVVIVIIINWLSGRVAGKFMHTGMSGKR